MTASKLPRLLGFCGHKEFSQAWFCIHNKVDERKVAPEKIKKNNSRTFPEELSLREERFSCLKIFQVYKCFAVCMTCTSLTLCSFCRFILSTRKNGSCRN